MKLTINATTGSPEANSYLSLDEANAMAKAEARHKHLWTPLSDEQKAQALIMATKQIDACAYKTAPLLKAYGQALQFPRVNSWFLSTPAQMIDCNYLAVPALIGFELGRQLSSVAVVDGGICAPTGEVRRITGVDSLHEYVSTDPFTSCPEDVQIIILEALPAALLKACFDQALHLIQTQAPYVDGLCDDAHRRLKKFFDYEPRFKADHAA
jgi:hypothetical protein